MFVSSPFYQRGNTEYQGMNDNQAHMHAAKVMKEELHKSGKTEEQFETTGIPFLMNDFNATGPGCFEHHPDLLEMGESEQGYQCPFQARSYQRVNNKEHGYPDQHCETRERMVRQILSIHFLSRKLAQPHEQD